MSKTKVWYNNPSPLKHVHILSPIFKNFLLQVNMQKISLENFSTRHIVFLSEWIPYKNVWIVYLSVLHNLIQRKKSVSFYKNSWCITLWLAPDVVIICKYWYWRHFYLLFPVSRCCTNKSEANQYKRPLKYAIENIKYMIENM